MDQPGKVDNPARGQLNRENEYSPVVPVHALEFGYARRVQPSRPVSACSFCILRPTLVWCLLTGFLPISTVASIFLFKPPYTIESVPNSSGHAITYRWRPLPRVRRKRVCSPQGSSSNGCCQFADHHGPIYIASLFPHPLMV